MNDDLALTQLPAILRRVVAVEMPEPIRSDVLEAADAIEELTRANERLKAEVQNWERSFPMCHMGIEGECSAEQRWKSIIAEQRAEVERLNAALGGLSPEATRSAIKLAADVCREWEHGTTHHDNYYVAERWWRRCPPEVRAELTKASPAWRAQILKQGELT